jgi:hypothetical protein
MMLSTMNLWRQHQVWLTPREGPWSVARLGSTAYAIEMFRAFNPEFHAWFAPIYRRLPEALVRKALPFYGGEILVMATKA